MKVTRCRLTDVPAAYTPLASGSFFASPGFLELWRVMGGEPVVWVAEDGGALAGAIPGVEFGGGVAARFASLPDGCAGGVLAAAKRSAVARPLLDAVVGHGYAKIAVFDRAASGAEHPALTAEPYETLIADLSGPDWRPPDKTLQSEIRKAEREGVHVERFDWARHGEGFLALVAGTAKRHEQSPRYPRELFERLAVLAERDPRVIWRYVARDGRPAASQIYFAEGDMIVSWQDYFDKALSFLKPNQYIRWVVCREAASKGARWLNLGATPAGASGVADYKRHWGGDVRTLVAQTRWTGLGALLRRGKLLLRLARAGS